VAKEGKAIPITEMSQAIEPKAMMERSSCCRGGTRPKSAIVAHAKAVFSTRPAVRENIASSIWRSATAYPGRCALRGSMRREDWP
jgi:hypothetical protein